MQNIPRLLEIEDRPELADAHKMHPSKLRPLLAKVIYCCDITGMHQTQKVAKGKDAQAKLRKRRAEHKLLGQKQPLVTSELVRLNLMRSHFQSKADATSIYTVHRSCVDVELLSGVLDMPPAKKANLSQDDAENEAICPRVDLDGVDEPDTSELLHFKILPIDPGSKQTLTSAPGAGGKVGGGRKNMAVVLYQCMPGSEA